MLGEYKGNMRVVNKLFNVLCVGIDIIIMLFFLKFLLNYFWFEKLKRINFFIINMINIIKR